MKKILLIWSCILLIIGCDSGEKKTVIVKSKGLPSELLLVVDKSIWETDVQDTLKQITEGSVPGLMQNESMFRVTRIFSKDYERVYVSMHSKLFVHLDPKLQKPMMGINRNVTARPQIEVTVNAPNLDELRGFLSRNAERIQQIIADEQIEMRTQQLNKKYSKKVSDDLQKVLEMTIRVPENLIATKKAKNFLWGGSNLNQKDLNIVVYTLPWDGITDVLTPEYYVAHRDSVMKENIPGSREDQWMQTTREKDFPLVISNVRMIDGKMVQEVRGLWEMRNGALGGPFVSLTRIDSTEHRVIVTEGFVYSPSTDKRDLVRQMEAALRTLKY